MTDNNNDNTNTPINLADFKARKESVGSVNPTPQPTDPAISTFIFRLVDGTEREITGFLSAGPGQVLVGNKDGMLIYLVPVDSLLELMRVED